MRHLGIIAFNTFRESIREPVYFLMLLAGLLLIGHYPWMTIFVFFEQLKLVADGALATSMLFALSICVLCAGATVSREMRNGTVLLLLSKPIPRWSFVLGKICGIAAAGVLFVFICSCASVISIYVAVDQFRMEMHLYGAFLAMLALGSAFGMLMNYLRGGSFAEHATWATAVTVLGMMIYCIAFRAHPAMAMRDFAKALLLLHFAVILMAVIAVGVAVRFDQVGTLGVCTMLFFLGLMSGHLFLHTTASPVVNSLLSLGYAVVPNWQLFWMADALAINRPIPNGYLVNCALYAALYSLLAALWAIILFQDREAAGDTRN